MTQDDSLEMIATIMSEVMDQEVPAAPDVGLEAIGANSMDVLDLAMKIEKRMGVVVPTKAMSGMRTLGDVAAFVSAAKLGEGGR